jgi:hypothetical protein
VNEWIHSPSGDIGVSMEVPVRTEQRTRIEIFSPSECEVMLNGRKAIKPTFNLLEIPRSRKEWVRIYRLRPADGQIMLKWSSTFGKITDLSHVPRGIKHWTGVQAHRCANSEVMVKRVGNSMKPVHGAIPMAVEKWCRIDKISTLALKEVCNRILRLIASEDVGLAIPRGADEMGLPNRGGRPPRS